MRDRLPPPWHLMTSRVSGDNASAQQAVGDWANQEEGGPVRGAFTSQWNVKFPTSMSKTPKPQPAQPVSVSPSMRLELQGNAKSSTKTSPAEINPREGEVLP